MTTTADRPPTPVWVFILGPVEVVGPFGAAGLSGSRQRTVVGVLAASAPRLVTRTALVEALWGGDPPRTAVKTLHSHIARIRRAFDTCGLPGLLVTRDPGYLLAIPPAAIDAHVFAEGVRRGRERLSDGDLPAAVAELRAALAWWRGEPFADARPSGAAAGDLDRWHELRIDGLIDLWDGQIRLGHHALAVTELELLAAAHPWRERIVGLLMLALYRGDRQADALAAYQRLRTRLADELGVAPGAAVRRLHLAILRGEQVADGTPPAGSSRADVPRPAQLPAPAGHFTGRNDEIEALDRLAGSRSPASDAGPAVAIVTGAAGVGKTTLAVEWGHRAAGRFPDGTIFVDLRDGGTPRSGAEALAHVLASLGVPAERLPTDQAVQVGLYRSLVNTRRILIVADNADRAAQVLSLVPPHTGAMLLVTARTSLPRLGTLHAVTTIGLDMLRHHEAVALLRRLLGEVRVGAAREATAELAELCGRMPLALRIAAAKLAARPAQPIADMVAELASDGRLDALSVDGDARGVRGVFASAYQVLSGPGAAMFRLLGLVPGAVVDVHLAAAVSGLSLAGARRTVAELTAAHLLTEVEHERYRFHDLIRLYARECADRDEPEIHRTEAADRVVDWYLAIADAANRILASGRDRITPQVRHPPERLPFGATAVAALTFLDAERPNLLPVVAYAADRADPSAAWQLTYLLTAFFDARGHWTERPAMCRLGVVAAQRAGDTAAEGLMRSGLGVACIMTNQFDAALAELDRALALMRESGDRRGEAHVENNIAVANAGLGRFDGAIEAYHRALALHTAQDNEVGVALALNNIGDAYVRLGRPELATEYLHRALAMSRTLRSGWLEGAALSGLGQGDLHRGDLDGALGRFQAALAVRQETGDRRYEAETLHHLGLTYLRRAEYGAAVDHLLRALAQSQQTANPHLEAQVLHSLGRTYLSRDDLIAARGYLHLALALRLRVTDPHHTAAIRQDLVDLDQRARHVGAPGHLRLR